MNTQPIHSHRSTRLAHLLLGLTLLGLAAPPAGRTEHLTSPDQVPAGLAKSDWQSIRAAYEAGRHAFQPVEGGWQARNPGQQWLTHFDGRGFVAQPPDAGWQWGLELKSYGFAGAARAIGGVPAVKAAGQRLTYEWDAAVQEWFVNDAHGLEHGFTVLQRPGSAHSQSSLLTFQLAVRGNLKPVVSADAKGVLFQDAAGATVIDYTGLKVWDANGRTLPSRFEAAETEPSPQAHAPESAGIVNHKASIINLLVDERGARYPLTIDPIAQQAYLKASNTGDNDQFGYSVAVSGDTVVVGAYGEASSSRGVNSTPFDRFANFYSGAAYVFVRSAGVWTQQAYLKASNTGLGDSFGWSVAVSGDTVVVGARYESSNATGVNAPVTGGSGTQADNSAGASGAAYVFTRSGTTWTQQAYLKASNTGQGDEFGESVAVSGDTVVVGAHGEDSSTTDVNSTPDESASASGAAYVFTRSGTTWTQQAYLKASNTGGDDEFGHSVAVAGDTVVVGAFGEDSSTTGVNSTPNESASLSGAAYVFARSGTTWTQEAYLKASNTGLGDQFGVSVGVSGDTVVVGAYGEDSSTRGVNSTPNESASASGAAYVFTRSGTTWSQQAYLKASNTGLGDSFGWSVAVSGDMVVVGARNEDSNATGVNAPVTGGSGTQADNSAVGSGAAYVFTRSGTTWRQQAYLKPAAVGATQTSDEFGRSVAVSGDTMVVGANLENSSTTGVNSTPDESASFSGAAYIFVRPPNSPPTANAGDDQMVECTSVTLDGSGSTDPEGTPDIVRYEWTEGATPLGSVARLMGFFSPGVHDITLTVTDAAGATDTDTVQITVPDPSAPFISSLLGPTEPLIEGSMPTVMVNFTDAQYQGHTVTFDWDEAPAAFTTVTLAAGVTTAWASHRYNAAGVYTVGVTVTDDCGNSASSIFEFVVIYDPNGGFVTGGGWIHSPLGAFVPDPGLAGTASFGFVSKYLRGATKPTGETEFQFQVGNLTFHSTVYEWLVIAGARAQYKGSGTINGVGNYGFLLTATDGQVNGGGGVDKFRIKIWDKNDAGAVVYDNAPGSDDINSSGQTAIAGGSIVLHK